MDEAVGGGLVGLGREMRPMRYGKACRRVPDFSRQVEVMDDQKGLQI